MSSTSLQRGAEDVLRALTDLAGTTYAEQAGITLRDTPAPLYRLLVLSVLLSTRIRADLAVDATRALVDAGAGTPERMAAMSWQDRVDALGRAHYRRYDESTATALGDGAELVRSEYGSDLRRLRAKAGGDPTAVRDLLNRVPLARPDRREHLLPRGAARLARAASRTGSQGPRRRETPRAADDGEGARRADPGRPARRHRRGVGPGRARHRPSPSRSGTQI